MLSITINCHRNLRNAGVLSITCDLRYSMIKDFETIATDCKDEQIKRLKSFPVSRFHVSLTMRSLVYLLDINVFTFHSLN